MPQVSATLPQKNFASCQYGMLQSRDALVSALVCKCWGILGLGSLTQESSGSQSLLATAQLPWQLQNCKHAVLKVLDYMFRTYRVA